MLLPLHHTQAHCIATNRQQDLANYVDAKDYRNAILLALSMDQPRRLFSLLSDILSDTKSLLSSQPSAGSIVLSEVLASLSKSDIFRLLEYVRDWNSRSRNADVAQSILYALLTTQSSSEILRAAPAVTGLEVNMAKAKGPDPNISIGDIIEAMLPYTERHYARAERLEQESAFLDFVLGKMDEHVSELDEAAEHNADNEAKQPNGFAIDTPVAGR